MNPVYYCMLVSEVDMPERWLPELPEQCMSWVGTDEMVAAVLSPFLKACPYGNLNIIFPGLLPVESPPESPPLFP